MDYDSLLMCLMYSDDLWWLLWCLLLMSTSNTSKAHPASPVQHQTTIKAFDVFWCPWINADRDADVDVDNSVDINADVDADINADVDADSNADVDADINADVDADINALIGTPMSTLISTPPSTLIATPMSTLISTPVTALMPTPNTRGSTSKVHLTDIKIPSSITSKVRCLFDVIASADAGHQIAGGFWCSYLMLAASP